MISNRFYVVTDNDSLADERDLINLTCNELDDQADADGDGLLEYADDYDDDPVRQRELIAVLQNESLSRGWYRVLDEQGNCISGMLSHVGEKVLSQPTLFFKNIYFTSYQPSFDDPCNPTGSAFIYGLDYCYGKSVFNYSLDNDDVDHQNRDIRDTFLVIGNSSIPSGVRVITRGGHAAGLISAGGAVSGVGEGQSTNIPGPPGGVSQMLWETD
jgi:hypothetical protein